MREAVGLGALNVDHFYQVERILADDESVVEAHSALPGGSAANTIYALAKLDVSCGFLGAVGDDEAGNTLVEDFSNAGVDTSQIRVKKGAKTGEVLCLTDRGGARTLYVSPGANSLLTEDDIELDYVRGAKLVHLSSFVDDQQLALQRWLVDSILPSVKLSFSPGAIYARKGLEELLPILERTELLFLTEKEVQALTGSDFPDGARGFLADSCEAVVVTFGQGRRLQLGQGPHGENSPPLSAGIIVGDREYGIETLAPPEIPPEDATGGGDAFAAGVLYGYLRGEDWKVCGRLGYCLAQLAISRLGARPGLPSREELAAKYEGFYGQVPNSLKV